mgnify:CR=1 FL=1
MISNASKYAIRAVLFLADKSSVSQKFGAVEIAEALEIPPHFIAKLLQQLAREKVISSSKGPTGGFYLDEKNLNLKVCDVLNVIEIKNVFEGCFLGLPKCSPENPCPVHHIVADFRKDILGKFERQTIREFSDDVKKNGTFISHKGIF